MFYIFFYLIFVVLSCLTILLLIMAVSLFVDDEPSDGVGALLFGAIFFCITFFGIMKSVDYYESDPVMVPLSEISIMHDDEVAIVRFKDNYRETFTDHKAYQSVVDTNFILYEVKCYDLMGDFNESEYFISVTKSND